MSSPNNRLLKSSLLLFGSMTFGYNASITLHELGHAIAYWIIGEPVKCIIIQPFSWSYCIPRSVSEYPNFTIWGGVVFGTLMGLLLVAAVWRWRSPYVMLVFIIGVVACIHNGFYLIFSCLAKSRGDATSLLYYGTPKAVIISVGLLVFGLGIVLAVVCLRLIGIRSTDGVKSRILVLGGGLLPYLVATLLYQWLYNAEELGMWIIKGMSIAVLVFLFGVLSAIVQRRVRWLRYAEVRGVTWSAVILANLGAFVLLSIIFMSLRFYKPIITTRCTLGYYDNQSNFAGVKLKIVDDITAWPSRRYQSESMVFWSWLGQKGKKEIPDSMAYSAIIYPQTVEVIVETMKGILGIPVDGKLPRWIFKQDDLLLHFKWAVSPDRSKVLVYGLDPNLREDVLIAVDVLDGRTTKFEISEIPRGIVFVNDNTVVASVGEDLVRIEFAESGDHKFGIDLGAAKKGRVEAVYKGEFVFHRPVIWTKENADQHIVECGNMKISFSDPVPFVLASKSYIWAIDSIGRVFKVNSDGNKLCVGTYTPNEMIGHGIFDDSLWIAFSDGTIEIFGAYEGTANIELP